MNPGLTYLEWCDSNPKRVKDVAIYYPLDDGHNIRINFKDGSFEIYPNYIGGPTDYVNHPTHYQSESGLETIKVIEAFTSNLTGIEAVCTANIIKYICRWKKKNGIEDLQKAKWYLEYLINSKQKEND